MKKAMPVHGAMIDAAKRKLENRQEFDEYETHVTLGAYQALAGFDLTSAIRHHTTFGFTDEAGDPLGVCRVCGCENIERGSRHYAPNGTEFLVISIRDRMLVMLPEEY